MLNLFGVTIITGDPYAEQARVAREAIEFQRETAALFRPDGVLVLKRGRPLQHAAKLTNCCNCGAPGEPVRCSYCLSPTP